MEFYQPEDHVNWSPERKMLARDLVKWIGRIQKLFIESRVVFPVLVLLVFGLLFWFAGWAGETLAGMLPKPF